MFIAEIGFRFIFAFAALLFQVIMLSRQISQGKMYRKDGRIAIDRNVDTTRFWTMIIVEVCLFIAFWVVVTVLYVGA